MQKVVLVAALAGTLGATLYAYPTTDKHAAFNLKNPATGSERGEGPVITGLDKLKAATTRTEPAPRPTPLVPPPSVMTSVREEIGARQAAPPSATPAQAPKTTAATDKGKDAAIEKLVARLPPATPAPAQATAGAAFHPLAAPKPPATVQAAVIAVPAAPPEPRAPTVAAVSSQATAGATAATASSKAVLQAKPPAVDRIASQDATSDTQTNEAGHSKSKPKPERKRVVRAASSGPASQGQGAPVVIYKVPSPLVARYAHVPSPFRRNDGM